MLSEATFDQIVDLSGWVFKKLLDAGIISRGASECASPTVLVRKRDHTVRYCIELRKVTVKYRYPFPKISECIDALAGCEYFGLDMANGYYQIKMEGEDRRWHF